MLEYDNNYIRRLIQLDLIGGLSPEEKGKLEKSGKNYLFHGADEELAAYLEDIRLGRKEG